MIHFVSLTGQVYINPDHTRSVQPYTEKPRFADARNCELIIPTFGSRSTVALTNGMVFYTNKPRQEILSAIDNAKQHAHDVGTQPCAVSDHILVDPMRITAILPYIAQLREYVEEHGYSVRSVSQAPLCLIVMDDGNTCLAVKDTPAELVDKISQPRQA